MLKCYDLFLDFIFQPFLAGTFLHIQILLEDCLPCKDYDINPIENAFEDIVSN